jgi:Domain of unknown function (DUF4365)
LRGVEPRETARDRCHSIEFNNPKESSPRETKAEAPMTPAPPIHLRGEGPKTLHMEELQKSYIQAIAAAAGCTVAEFRVDANKIDLLIEHKSITHLEDLVMTLRMQLKSTHTVSHSTYSSAPRASFPFVLDNTTLNVLAAPRFTIPRILVVMLMPKHPQDWVVTGSDHLVLHNRCYWVSLTGVAATGVDSTTVQVPWANVLDAQTLCDIMGRIGQGGAP